MNNLKKFGRIAASFVILASVSAGASAQIFKGETAGVGDPVHTMFVYRYDA